jgi:hypothetical protein
MGNKGNHEQSDYPEDDKQNQKKPSGNLRASTDWRLKHGKDDEEKQENPALIDVEHLLRYTQSKVVYDADFHPDLVRYVFIHLLLVAEV